jgi:hypothetical protein
MSVPIVVRGGLLATNGSTLPLDAFGRMRISTPTVILSCTSTRATENLLMDVSPAVTGVTITDNVSGVLAGTTTMSAAVQGPGTTTTAACQTYTYAPYIPGVSKLMLFSGILAEAGPSSVSLGQGYAYGRIGCWDGSSASSNGLFWEWDWGRAAGTQLAVCIMRLGVITRVTQNNFNGNPLTALALSAITGTAGTTVAADFTKAQVMWIDQEWLGVGSVRFGIAVQDVFIVAHTITNMNALEGPYTPIANAPIRYEATIVQGPTYGGTATVTIIRGCSTVQLETPDIAQSLISSSIAFGYTTPVYVFPNATEWPVMAFRATTSAAPGEYYDGSRAAISLTSMGGTLTSTNDTLLLRIYRVFTRRGLAYGTVTATSTSAYVNPQPLLPSNSVSACQMQIAGSPNADDPAQNFSFTKSGGGRAALLIWSGGLSGVGRISLNDFAVTLGVSMDSVADQLVLTAQNVGSGGFTAVFYINWLQAA